MQGFEPNIPGTKSKTKQISQKYIYDILLSCCGPTSCKKGGKTN